MRVLLTGISGFIGSHLSKKLLEEGNDVFGIVRNSSSSQENSVETFEYNGTLESLVVALTNCKPDSVIHLATYYSHSNENIDSMIEANLAFGIKLLTAMNAVGVKKLVNVGSSFEHYNNEDYRAVNLYAALKHSFQKIVEYHADAYSFTIITLKLFDTYGPNDSRKKLLWYIKNSIKKKNTLQFSPGDQILDFIHVDDVVRGFLQCLNILERCEDHTTFALSSGDRVTLKALVKLIRNIIKVDFEVEWGDNYREREVMEPWNNFNKLPNWNPEITLEKGIRKYFLNE